MRLKEITLLSEEEYKKYKPLISLIPRWWWLKTPYPGYGDCVRDVDNGNLDGHSCYFNYGGGVRPFCIFNLESSDPLFWYKPETLVGSEIKYGRFEWTILNVENGELCALCDKIIAERRFDPKTNAWEDSELKRWLETEGIKLLN